MKLPHWGPLQGVIWWIVLRIFDVENVGELQVIDLRDDQNNHPLLVQRLGEAQDWIRKRRGGFPELVFSHIDTVIAIEQDNTAVPKRRLFVTAFKEAEQDTSFYLACQLVWAATFIRLQRDSTMFKLRRPKQSMRQKAIDEQVRFASHFPDAEGWVRKLQAQS